MQNTTRFENGPEKDLQEILRELLVEKFGPLNPNIRTRLEQFTDEELAKLSKAFLRAQSLRDLGLDD